MRVGTSTAGSAVRDRGRFAPPQPLAGEIERHRLDIVYEEARGRVLVLAAPTGYGKSTLAARWTRSDRRSVRWLDLEPVDDDPVALMRSIGAALDGLDGRGEAPLDDGLLHESFDVMLDAIDEPFVLVIDDVDHLRSPLAAAVVQRVARSIGGESTLLLAGRDLEEGLATALRLAPGTIELASDRLAFSDAETTALMNARLPATDVRSFAATISRYEGWPAGLALAIANRDGATFDSPAGSNEPVVAVWLEQLDPDDRALLTELACLGRFHPDMCGDVLGRTGCRSDLRRLRRRQFVVDALDERGEWFRLHHLVADWLSRELRSEQPERWAELHRLAADWWEREGDVDLVFEFAHMMGDVDRCVGIIAEHGGSFVADGRHRTVQRWFETLGDDAVRAKPELCATAAVIETQLGDFPSALRWTRALAHSNGRTRLPDDLRLQTDVLSAAFELQPTTELRPSLEAAVRELPGGAWRSFGCWALGAFRYLHGDTAEALAILDDGAFEAQVAGVHRLQANNAAMKATIEFLEGSPTASTNAVAAYRRLERSVPDITPPSANLVSMVALDEARSGRRDGATAMIDRCLHLLDGFGPVSAWYQAYTLVILSTASLHIGDAKAARRHLDRAETLLRPEDTPHGLTPHVDDLRTRVTAAEQLGLDPAWTLTTAELNVLQYLPTNLSLGDIASELFVSRNTVKSHTASIYRKLGTTSRAETVDAARAAGMLSPLP